MPDKENSNELIGIVILNYMSWELTVECVTNIRENIDGDLFLVLVDNASPNESYTRLCELYSDDANVTCILAEKNGGYAYGNNIGIRECQRKGIQYAVVTNNDVIFNKNSIKELVLTLKKNNNAVLTSPKIYDAWGNIGGYPFLGKPTLCQFLGLSSMDSLRLDLSMDIEKKVYSVPCCCYAINVDKLLEMGALDEGTFLYVEEGTLAKRAFLKGYSIIFNPRATVIHNHVESEKKTTAFYEKCLAESALYYWHTYESDRWLITLFIWNFFSMRLLIKVLMKKTESKNIGKVLKEYRNYCFKLLRGEKDE